jgi:enoyl-CoA hydratase/carnithine racemase
MVAAVKGICFTVGIELMLGADIVVAADNCRFAQLEVQRCIMPTGGATLRMAERAGVGNAMLHLLTGDEFDSAEALRCNFVQKVVPAGQELAEALRIAERIAQQAPQAVVATRQNVLKAIELGQAAAVADFIPVQQRLATARMRPKACAPSSKSVRHGSPEPSRSHAGRSVRGRHSALLAAWALQLNCAQFNCKQ